MKITDVTLTLFAWDNIPPTTYGTDTGEACRKQRARAATDNLRGAGKLFPCSHFVHRTCPSVRQTELAAY